MKISAWGSLFYALEWYQEHGYEFIEVPWLVSPWADAATKPANGASLEVLAVGGERSLEYRGHLPASGEQSFLDLLAAGKLVDGKKYQTLTPCWRVESEYNRFTRPWFMKVELIHVGATDADDTCTMAQHARWCMGELMPAGTSQFELKYEVQGESGLDITYRGIELGSYGTREHNGHKWVFGTGLAEPRFTEAVYGTAP